jgi:hypothetical protein
MLTDNVLQRFSGYISNDYWTNFSATLFQSNHYGFLFLDRLAALLNSARHTTDMKRILGAPPQHRTTKKRTKKK